MTSSNQSPFKNNPALWLLIAIPLTSVIVGITFLGISIKEFDGVVADDYYKRGKLINQTIERDNKANELGLVANVDLRRHSEHAVLVKLTPISNFEYPDTIQLNIIHRTRSGKDQQLVLHHVGEGQYSGLLMRQLTTSHWILQITTSDWRINGELDWPHQQMITFANNSK